MSQIHNDDLKKMDIADLEKLSTTIKSLISTKQLESKINNDKIIVVKYDEYMNPRFDDYLHDYKQSETIKYKHVILTYLGNLMDIEFRKNLDHKKNIPDELRRITINKRTIVTNKNDLVYLHIHNMKKIQEEYKFPNIMSVYCFLICSIDECCDHLFEEVQYCMKKIPNINDHKIIKLEYDSYVCDFLEFIDCENFDCEDFDCKDFDCENFDCEDSTKSFTELV